MRLKVNGEWPASGSTIFRLRFNWGRVVSSLLIFGLLVLDLSWIGFQDPWFFIRDRVFHVYRLSLVVHGYFVFVDLFGVF